MSKDFPKQSKQTTDASNYVAREIYVLTILLAAAYLWSLLLEEQI